MKVEAAAQMIEQALPDAFKGDSHALLMSVYKDPTQPLPLRIDAAKAAIGYEKPKLAAVEHSGNQDKPVAYSIVSGVEREEANEMMNGHGDSRTDH